MPADEIPPPTTTTISPTSTDKPTPTTTAAAPMPIEALNEPEIVAVSPPPQGPKQSQPAPPRPVEPPTSAVSPVVRKLETLALAVPPQGGDPSEFYVELPDTSVPRPASAGADAAAGSSGVAGAAEMGGGEDAAEAAKEAGPGATPARAEAAEAVPAAAVGAKPVLATLRAPVDDVSVLVAEDVVMTPGGARMDFDDFEEMLLGGEKTLGGHWREEYGRQRERKRKDPAVLVEIPSTPSAHAYEVAAHNKLDEQYFAPVYEDKGTADEVELPPPSRRVTTEDLAADAADKNKTGAEAAAEEKGSAVAAVAAGAAAAVKDAALKVVDTLTGGTGGTKA